MQMDSSSLYTQTHILSYIQCYTYVYTLTIYIYVCLCVGVCVREHVRVFSHAKEVFHVWPIAFVIHTAASTALGTHDKVLSCLFFSRAGGVGCKRSESDHTKLFWLVLPKRLFIRGTTRIIIHAHTRKTCIQYIVHPIIVLCTFLNLVQEALKILRASSEKFPLRIVNGLGSGRVDCPKTRFIDCSARVGRRWNIFIHHHFTRPCARTR